MGFSLILIITVLPLVAGVLLIVFSGRRGPAHPSCGKCGYNVHGSIGSVTRCPECGAAFGEVGITPPGGRRSPVMIAAGMILVVLAMGCFGSSLMYQRAAVARARAQAQAARSAAVQNAIAKALAEAQAAQEAAEADAEQAETGEDREAD